MLPNAFALVFGGFRLPPLANTGLWAETADDVGVDIEATGVAGDEDRDMGEEDLSLSMNEAVDEARSFDGTFKCEPDGVDLCT
jgi:hypothetical protein